MPILANLVLGVDGATTINGSSKGLSNPPDRLRFHALRKKADLIIIGGNTSVNEPYEKTPVPLVVITHHQEIPGSALNNPKALISHANIASTVKEYSQHFETILIEGGATLLKEALEESIIDSLFITKTDHQGDGPYFAIPAESGLVLKQEERSPDGQDLFLIYARLPD